MDASKKPPALTLSHDPTREELLAFLYAVAARDFGLSQEDAEFDVEEAAYYIACHWHGGMRSNLYSVSSTSPYSPGRGQDDLTGDEAIDGEERAVASWCYSQANAAIDAAQEGR